MLGNVNNASSSSSSDGGCSAFLNEVCAEFGFYTIKSPGEQNSFPNVSVELAEKVDQKKLRGPLKFIDSNEHLNHVETALKVEGYFLTCGGIGIGVGVVCGGAIGGGIGFAVGGNPVSIASGAVVGGVVGGLVGSQIGLYIARKTSYIAVQDSDEYQEWNEARIEKSTKKMLLDYCAMYFPQDLICPITGMLPAFPVFANGQIYEKEAIEDWLDTKRIQEREMRSKLSEEEYSKEDVRQLIREHRSTVCPMQGPYFTKADLVCNEDAFSKIESHLQRSFKNLNDINDDLKSEPVKKLFVALMKNKTLVVDQKIKQAVSEMNKHQIPKHYQEEVKAHLLNSV